MIPSDKTEPRLKVKLTTSSYRTSGSYIQQKNLYFYKKPNPEHLIDAFEEDMGNSCLGNLEDRIINLSEVEDGVYELDTCNISTDWETGWVDDWDWQLTPWRD